MVGYNCELSQHSSRWLNSALRDDEAVYLVSNQCKTAMAGTLCCWVSIRSNHLVIIGIWGIADLHFHMMSLMSFVKAILRLKVKKTQNDEFPVHCSPTTALQYGNKDPSAFLQWWRWFFLPNNQPAPKTLCIVGHCVGASPPLPWFTEAPSTSLSTWLTTTTQRLSRRSAEGAPRPPPPTTTAPPTTTPPRCPTAPLEHSTSPPPSSRHTLSQQWWTRPGKTLGQRTILYSYISVNKQNLQRRLKIAVMLKFFKTLLALVKRIIYDIFWERDVLSTICWKIYGRLRALPEPANVKCCPSSIVALKWRFQSTQNIFWWISWHLLFYRLFAKILQKNIHDQTYCRNKDEYSITRSL